MKSKWNLLLSNVDLAHLYQFDYVTVNLEDHGMNIGDVHSVANTVFDVAVTDCGDDWFTLRAVRS